MIHIDTELVRGLIQTQFPQWASLQIRPVEKSGYDNRTFHLGDDMSVRLPIDEGHSPQVEKEMRWLPMLKRHLSLPVQTPLAKGHPADGYPFYWSVNQWIEGETLDNVSDMNLFASDLSSFLKEMQAIDSSNGPAAGAHNYYRGGSLSVYHEQTVTSIASLGALIDTEKCQEIWRLALSSEWRKRPVWIHGDIAPGNLLVKDGRLCAVIDFGIMGVGDPACELTMAWTFFDDKSRQTFIGSVGLDEETTNRARGWALWKALITYDQNEKTSVMAIEGKRVLDTIIREYDGSI